MLHPDLLNENVKKAQYAVRGELYIRGEELRKAGKEITFTNVGNPHALGQKPLTFNRQVQALVSAPFLLDNPALAQIFKKDAIARAKHLLKLLPGGVGAYTDSRGAPGIRQEIADFIERRDGHPSNPDHIFVTDGASPAVRYLLNAIIRDEHDGLLVPIPQYPLYSASIQLYGGTLIPYNLKEDNNWGLNVDDLRQAAQDARERGLAVRALVFINPGNPTGQCLSTQNLQEIIQFCYEEGVVLMADEVYQENVYQDERPFVSAKKVLREMPPEIANSLELCSFHTVSKGALGECGLRGGYVEMTNVHPGSVEEIYKIASINLCSNVMGQVSLSLSLNGPKPGDESYEQHQKERKDIIASLRRRSHIMTDAFNSCEGITCNFTEGAMYSFPRLHLPPKAMEAAKQAGKSPDTFYCLKLLEATGISTVPGSGFGQEPGSFHLRTTILPSEDKIKQVAQKFKDFHANFMQQHR